jgi:type VI secretion system protein ImpH
MAESPSATLVVAAMPPPTVRTLKDELYEPEGICAFDFFQAIRLLIQLDRKERVLVGQDGPPHREIARFAAHLSLSFPASSVHQITPGADGQPPKMIVNFLGMTGPSGVLPRHYTERLMLEARGPEKRVLQDWLDLFNHRFVSLFYRAWEKYHFFLPYERGEAAGRDPDAFSRCLFSLVGLGSRSQRNRFRIAAREIKPVLEEGFDHPREKELGQLDDLALLRFSGLFAHRPRCAVSLETFLEVHLQLPIKVFQFQGQWLHLNPDSQTATGALNNRLGHDTLVGDRMWDVQSKVRIRLGPLTYMQFLEFLPDRSAVKKRKRIFLLAQLVRYYLGSEMDVEFQLVLKQGEVPAAQTGPHIRLGWNTWSRQLPYPKNADDTVFSVSDKVFMNDDAAD